MSTSVFDTESPYRLIVTEIEGRVLVTDRQSRESFDESVDGYERIGYEVVSTLYGKRTKMTKIMIKRHSLL